MVKLWGAEEWLDYPAEKMKADCLKEGFLLKEGAKSKNWKRRYFVLKFDWLIYYETEQSLSPVGAMFLGDIVFDRLPSYSNKSDCFTIKAPNCKDHIFCLEQPNPQQTSDWLNAISNASNSNLQKQMRNMEQVQQRAKEMLEQLSQQQDFSDKVKHELDMMKMMLRQSKEREMSLRQQLKHLSIQNPSFESNLLHETIDERELAVRFSYLDQTTEKKFREGWLFKRGLVNRSRKKRWFVLSGYTLVYYKSAQESEPLGIITLEHCKVNISNSQAPRQSASNENGRMFFEFEIVHGVTDRTYQLASASLQERDSWIAAINESLQLAIDQKIVSGFSTVADVSGSFEDSALQIPQLFDSLKAVLGDPQQLECFRLFLAKEYASESLLFYLDAENMKVISDAVLPIVAQNIFIRYIEVDAPYEVNLASRTVESIRQELDNPHREIFTAAQKEIFILMRDDCFPRFTLAVKAIKEESV